MTQQLLLMMDLALRLAATIQMHVILIQPLDAMTVLVNTSHAQDV
jgi:hypothetical protein